MFIDYIPDENQKLINNLIKTTHISFYRLLVFSFVMTKEKNKQVANNHAIFPIFTFNLPLINFGYFKWG